MSNKEGQPRDGVRSQQLFVQRVCPQFVYVCLGSTGPVSLHTVVEINSVCTQKTTAAADRATAKQQTSWAVIQLYKLLGRGSVCRSVCPFIYLPSRPPARPSVHPSVCLSVCLSACLAGWLAVAVAVFDSLPLSFSFSRVSVW